MQHWWVLKCVIEAIVMCTANTKWSIIDSMFKSSMLKF